MRSSFKLNRLLPAALLCSLASSCDKHVHFSGTVFSRHNVPMPNATVIISLGHGEHDGGGGELQTATDSDGNFSSNTDICGNCWAYAISASTPDSGTAYSKDVGRNGGSNIELHLK